MKNRNFMLKLLIIVQIITCFSVTESFSGVTFNDRKSPKLVVNIVVSHMRYDYLSRFGKNFSENGFKKLMSGGMNCTNARYNYMFTQNSPGIVTLLSGTQPSHHGIIGDVWVNYTTNDTISSTIDTKELGVGCDESEGQYSPRSMVVSTVSDELKRYFPTSKVVSIAMDPNVAVLAGGYNPDGVYWFDERYGGWVTCSYYKDKLPVWIETFNGSDKKGEYVNKLWHVSIPSDNYVCKKSSSILLDTTVKFSLNMLFKSKNKEFNRLKQTPFGNTYLKDFAIETIKNDSLGIDDTPDMLILNFGTQAYITKYFGIESTELEDAIYKLDRDISDIVTYLEQNIGTDNFVIMLTSDHGTSDDVSDKQDKKSSSGTFNAMQFKVLISGFLGAQYGDGNWVSEYKNRQIYLNRRLVFERGLSLEDMQNKVATFALQFGGVAQAITSISLQNNYYGNGVIRKIQNSFYPKRSGDVVINLLPGWIELENEDAKWMSSSSGSPYEYDVHVPLLWYGGNIPSSTLHRQLDMVDIAPTLCDILGITHPNACDGVIINEIIKELK